MTTARRGTQADLAKRLGVSRSTVSQMVIMDKLNQALESALLLLNEDVL